MYVAKYGMIDKIKAAWQRMYKALDADQYRIQGQGYGNTPPINFNKSYTGDEHLWTAKEVDSNIYNMYKSNINNYQPRNIYCLPITDNVGYLLIDDVNNYNAVVCEYGKPSVILESSEANYQMIYRVRVVGLNINKDISESPERIKANNIMRSVNQKYGDPNISGIFHQFRMPGFINVKPSRNGWGVQLIEANEGMWNEQLSSAIASADISSTKHGLRPTPLSSPSCPVKPQYPAKAETASADPEHYHIYRQTYNRCRGIALYKGWNPDISRWDYQASIKLFLKGYNRGQVIEAILNVSPNIQARHRDITAYAFQTADKAEAHQHERQYIDFN